MNSARTTYLVARASCTTHGTSLSPYVSDDIHYQPFEAGDEGPVRVPEVIFGDRDAANRECNRRERAVRELLNPFWLCCGTPHDLTSLSSEEFCTRVCGLALSPPEPGNYGYTADWSEWWDRESADWTAEQRAGVWDLLDKVRLYEMIEIELE